MDLIDCLNGGELKQLKRYLQSPFCNENKDALQLFEYLAKVRQKAPSGKAYGNKRDAHAFVYGKQPYKDVKIRRLMSHLLKAVEDFLLHLRYKNDKIRREIDLANIYLDRNLDKHFNAACRQSEALLQNHPHRDADFYYQRYLREEALSNHLGNKANRRTEPNLQNVSDKLDVFYIVSKLRHCCNIANFRNLFKYDYDIKMLDEVLAHLQANDYSHVPAIKLYQYTLLTLTERESETPFYNLKDALEQYYDALPPLEMRALHTLARNYCIRKINGGATGFVNELFDLYRNALNNKLLLKDGVLAAWTYKNIIAVGLRLKEFEWTEAFAQQYGDHLPPDQRAGLMAFGLAKLHFERQKYGEVITLLNSVEINDQLTFLDVKVLLLKAFYELNEFNTLESLLDSFKIYLIRKKKLGYHKDNYLNIIKLSKQLINLNPYDKSKREILRERISNTKILSEKKWLLQKLQEL